MEQKAHNTIIIHFDAFLLVLQRELVQTRIQHIKCLFHMLQNWEFLCHLRNVADCLQWEPHIVVVVVVEKWLKKETFS